MWSRRSRACSAGVAAAFAVFLCSGDARAAEHWTELNIGPYYVDSDGDTNAARDALTQMEQLRWVMEGLLEVKDLRTVWPIRAIVSKNAQGKTDADFVLANGCYELFTTPGAKLPLGKIARVFLESNTTRLPAEVESGLEQMFDTLEAKGSRVNWGGTPAHPDPAVARIHLIATKFEYQAHFHIFLTALRGGSTLKAAERNSFATSPEAFEKEVTDHLAEGHWETVAVPGRPLDPKRDFGEHSLDATVAQVYVANLQRGRDPKAAEAAYRNAVNEGGEAAALGFEGLAEIDKLNKRDAHDDFENAIKAHSKSALVYVGAAEDRAAVDAVPLLKEAAKINPMWAEPVYRQAAYAENATEKEALIKRATQLEPRHSSYWIELAQLQAANGHAATAQGTWLKAEDSAPNETERARIHQMRVDSEQARLNAMEAENRRERDATRDSEQQSLRVQADAIRAAEERANRQQDAIAGNKPIGEVVPYASLLPTRKVSGVLTQVDCLKTGARLTVKNTKTGQTSALYLPETANAPLQLTCGPQKAVKRVTVTYKANPDDLRHTIGDITELAWQ